MSADLILTASFVTNAPNSTARTIPIWMRQRHLVVSDDLIIEICDIEGTIGTLDDIHWAKPWIVTGHKVPQFSGDHGRATPLNSIAIYTAGHHIAAKEQVAKRLWELLGLIILHATNGCATVQMVHHGWGESQTIMRSSKTWVTGTCQQTRKWLAVTIGGVPVSPFITAHAERIHLSRRELFDP